MRPPYAGHRPLCLSGASRTPRLRRALRGGVAAGLPRAAEHLAADGDRAGHRAGAALIALSDEHERVRGAAHLEGDPPRQVDAAAPDDVTVPIGVLHAAD